MTNIIVLAVIYFVGIGILLMFNEINYRRNKIQGEFTRKFAHFAAILAVLPLPYMFDSHWYILVLAIIFFAILYFTQTQKQLKSIHDIKRKSIGSYLLPLSIYVTFLIANKMDSKFLFILPMLILGVCDPMAAILGMNIKKYNGQIKIAGYKFNKTWLGSGTFLAMSLVISLIALYYHRGVFDVETLILSVCIAIVSTLGEFLSWRGSDNLTIPLSVVFILTLF
jgi:dolichol kinase